MSEVLEAAQGYTDAAVKGVLVGGGHSRCLASHRSLMRRKSPAQTDSPLRSRQEEAAHAQFQ
jgi:hypothetical protein